MQGGGNLGDAWPDQEKIRKKVAIWPQDWKGAFMDKYLEDELKFAFPDIYSKAVSFYKKSGYELIVKTVDGKAYSFYVFNILFICCKLAPVAISLYLLTPPYTAYTPLTVSYNNGEYRSTTLSFINVILGKS